MLPSSLMSTELSLSSSDMPSQSPANITKSAGSVVMTMFPGTGSWTGG